MDSWEDFAAFVDIAELTRVCDLLDDRANAIRDGLAADVAGDVADLVGLDSYLVKRIERQDTQSAAILAAERPDKPGLYARTWMAMLVAGLYVRLDEIARQPGLLPDDLPRLKLDFHRVLIAAHEIFDPHHRALLISTATFEAFERGKDKGKADEQSARTGKSQFAVTQRNDQLTRAEFVTWVKAQKAAGANPKTIREVKALSGFKATWLQGANDATLKKWAGAAGFELCRGRPATKK